MNTTLLPFLAEFVNDLAHALHLAWKRVYEQWGDVYPAADACWEASDNDGYCRLMRQRAALDADLEELDALYWNAKTLAWALAERAEAALPAPQPGAWPG